MKTSILFAVVCALSSVACDLECFGECDEWDEDCSDEAHDAAGGRSQGPKPGHNAYGGMVLVAGRTRVAAATPAEAQTPLARIQLARTQPARTQPARTQPAAGTPVTRAEPRTPVARVVRRTQLAKGERAPSRAPKSETAPEGSTATTNASSAFRPTPKPAPSFRLNRPATTAKTACRSTRVSTAAAARIANASAVNRAAFARASSSSPARL
jgi:hypothetical protein